jgi:hypothetical protein
MAGGDYAVACAELSESEDLDPQVGTALNLAYCYEQLGRTASAWSTWLKAASEATAKGQTERADVASVRAALLQKRLVHLTVTVKPQRARQRIQVTIDRAPLAPTDWGVPLPQDPGDHELVATADGFRPWRSRCTVATGAEPTVVVPELEPITSTASDRASAWEGVALATGAVGAATVAVGAGFGIAAVINRSASNAQGECAAAGCNQTGLAERSRAHDDALVAEWTLAAGGVALAAGAIVYYVLRSNHAAPRAAWSAGVSPSATGATVILGAEW